MGEYGDIEIQWKTKYQSDGVTPVTDKKTNTERVVSPPMQLVPKFQGEWGGWCFENLDGFWTYQGADTDIREGVKIEVVLELGGKKNNGSRYMDIASVKQIQNNSDTPPVEAQQAQPLSNSAPNQPQTLSAQSQQGIDGQLTARDLSIREQAYYNNLNPDILDRLPQPQQDALLTAYFDTAMLIMRESVRKRALTKLAESKVIEEAWEDGEPDSPMVKAVQEVGGIVESVTPKIETPASDGDRIIDFGQAENVEQLPW